MKTIPGFPDYKITDKGVLYSIAKRSNRGRPKKPVLKALGKSWGYYVVHLQINGRYYKRYVHRLVLETFVGKCPKGFQCRHLDGNRLNNNLSNLKWGTRSENQKDRVKHGTHNRGTRHGLSKLNENKVRKIRAMAKENKNVRKGEAGKGYKKIAKKFNVSSSTVGNVVRGTTWLWVK